MNPVPLETFLAKLYTDPVARRAFLSDPVRAARDAGLESEDVVALDTADRVGVKMAAASYAHKREQHRRPKMKAGETWLKWFKR
jgi:hypothetical protein